MRALILTSFALFGVAWTMTDFKHQVCVCLLYDFKLGKTLAESHRDLVKGFGNDVLFKSRCRAWFQRLQNGDESLEDDEHSRRPQAVDNNILRAAIESDPCETTRELAQKFLCSNSTIDEHLHAIGKTI